MSPQSVPYSVVTSGAKDSGLKATGGKVRWWSSRTALWETHGALQSQAAVGGDVVQTLPPWDSGGREERALPSAGGAGKAEQRRGHWDREGKKDGPRHCGGWRLACCHPHSPIQPVAPRPLLSRSSLLNTQKLVRE